MSARILPLVLLSLPAGALAAAVTVPFVAEKPAASDESSGALDRAAAAMSDLARRMDDVERESALAVLSIRPLVAVQAGTGLLAMASA